MSLDILRQEQSHLLTTNDFRDWKDGLPVRLDSVTDFDPQHYENLAICISHGWRGSTHDKYIFEDTEIGPYITEEYKIVSDLILLGRETLLGKNCA